MAQCLTRVSNMITTDKVTLVIIVVGSLFLYSCGGDEEPALDTPDPVAGKTSQPEEVPEKVEIVEEEEIIEEEIPDPNGVYLPIDKENKNGKPVYTNGNGFFMWFNIISSGNFRSYCKVLF